jgi:hypothetical protein
MHKLLIRCKKLIWALLVAYMIGIHNIYFQEQKSPDDIVLKIAEDHQMTDSAPKD